MQRQRDENKKNEVISIGHTFTEEAEEQNQIERKNRYLFISKVCILLNRYKIEVKLNNEVAGWMAATCAWTRCIDCNEAATFHFLSFVYFIKDSTRRGERKEACMHKTNKLIYKRDSHMDAIVHWDRLREQKDTRLKFRFHRIDVHTAHFVFILRIFLRPSHLPKSSTSNEL